jgi:voltage-dependent calcium channel N type alpha-1B
MDTADQELRETVRKLWPLQAVKKINLLIPTKEELHGTPQKRRLTVGKIYAGLLVLENYRSYKQSLARYGEARPVRTFFSFIR